MNKLTCFGTLFFSVMALGQDVSPKAATKSLARSTPEAEGISSAVLEDFLKTADQKVDTMHSFMLVRHGKVVAEAWWAPESAEKPHVMHSLSKSFTSMAVGFAVAEGKLSVDDLVRSHLPYPKPATLPAPGTPEEKSHKLASAMRVKDLLTMSTGHETEPSLKPDTPWVETFYDHPVKHKPGTHFHYNSPGTYMCSAIVQKLSGQTLLEYLKPRLFEPLGITGMTWMSCPQGISTGGWGLTLKTEDIAKFGQFCLQKGQCEGRQLIPAAWIEQATAKHVSNGSDPLKDWDQGYGFQFWRCRHGAYRGDGAHGQFCIVLPDQDAVVAITADTGDMQAQLNIVWEKLLPAFQNKILPENAAAHASLKNTAKTLRVREGHVAKVIKLPGNK